MSTRIRDTCPLDCKVYVGELGNNGTRHELEDAFGYYGPLREVWVARNPPGFAFVMFQDTRDARDAVRALDGKIICGRRVRVELSTGKSRHEDKRDGEYRYERSSGSDRGGRGGSDMRYSRESPRSGMVSRGGRDGYSSGGGRGYDDPREKASYNRRRYSRSRSRSMSPPIVRGGASVGRPRTPPSRSRSRSPIGKSPARYR